jgi:hypothetical protein
MSLRPDLLGDPIYTRSSESPLAQNKTEVIITLYEAAPKPSCVPVRRKILCFSVPLRINE